MRGVAPRFMPSYLWGHFLIRGYDVRMLLESASWVLTAKINGGRLSRHGGVREYLRSV